MTEPAGESLAPPLAARNGHAYVTDAHHFEIRPATVDDIPAIHALLDRTGLLIDGADYSNFSHVTLVGVRAGEIVGMIQALPAKPYAVVTDLAIAPEYHRRGYGFRLLQAIELALRMYGCTAWVACVADRNRWTLSALDQYAKRTGQGIGYLRGL